VRIAFIAAECEPWAKTGGLGDVVDALARALPRAVPGPGVEAVTAPVDVFLPRYRSVPVPPGRHPQILVRVPDPLAAGGVTTVRVLTIPGDGYRLRLVDYPPAFDRTGFYDHPDDAWRFGIFGRAALEALRADAAAGEPPVDVLSVHDWHSSPALLDRAGRLSADPVIGRAAAVLTIHNLAYHGWIPEPDLAQLGLAPGDGLVAPGAVGIDLLWDAIERAEIVNTVSPGFAAEALTPTFGFGLNDTLRAKGDRFVGILNGLDTDVWDPATDELQAARYSPADRAGKAICRADLLTRLGLDATDPGMVVGLIGRLDPQKGFDLLLDAAPRLLAGGARIVVQGNGDPALAARLRALAVARPSQVVFIDRFDRTMARRVYAGSDAFAMPSRFEPCGQGQMIALRYGTPPIVHATGGLRDTVIDEHDQAGEGTGFAFRFPTADGLGWATEEAMERFDAKAAGPRGWGAIVDRGMAVDFDWVRGSAPKYLATFQRAIGLRLAPKAVAKAPSKGAPRRPGAWSQGATVPRAKGGPKVP
jgi:starch synthase